MIVNSQTNSRFIIIFFTLLGLVLIIYINYLFNQTARQPSTIISEPSSMDLERIYKLLNELLELNKAQQANNAPASGKSSIDSIIGDLVGISKFQKDYDQELLFKTLKFMIREVDEYDPELVAFVRSMIIKLDRKYPGSVSIESERDDLRFVDNTLNSMRNGFCIEAGAFSATDHSNSLFFEVQRDWSGILIEPMPWYFKDIKNADRNAYILNACIARKTPLLAKFRIDSWGSGKENQMTEKQKSYIDNVWKNKGTPNDERYLFVPCFSLNTIMKALNVDKVDFFSLDVEGSEYEVIQSIDYDKLKIRLISIETTQSLPHKQPIIKHLTDRNYTLARENEIDVFLLKRF